MEDREIAERLRSGDERGMEALLGQYGPLLRYVVRPILPREEDREDCLSEISLRVWERTGGCREERGTLSAWLTAVARNAALDHARREGLRASEELSHQAADPAPSPEEEVLRRERRETLRRALDALDQRDRLLFDRKYYYCQSTAQIARERGSRSGRWRGGSIGSRHGCGSGWEVSAREREVLPPGGPGPHRLPNSNPATGRPFGGF